MESVQHTFEAVFGQRTKIQSFLLVSGGSSGCMSLRKIPIQPNLVAIFGYIAISRTALFSASASLRIAHTRHPPSSLYISNRLL